MYCKRERYTMSTTKLPKGWLLGAVLICGIITFMMIILGENVIELLSAVSFALILAYIANRFVKNAGAAKIPIIIVAFIIGTYTYAPVIERALLNPSLVVELGITMLPIWVVSIDLYLKIISRNNISEKQERV
jgi:hypothetical protein